MGDRCKLMMTIRKTGQAQLEELLRSSRLLGPEDSWRAFFSEIEEEDTSEVLHCTVDKANYGLFDERRNWAQSGLEFSGGHGEGGTYPAALFVAVDGDLRDVPALDGNPVVPVDAQGNPDTEDLYRVRCYLRASAILQSRWYDTSAAKDPAMVACELLVAAYQAGKTTECLD